MTSWPILVVDDQIGVDGEYRQELEDRVGSGIELAYCTGQDASGRNDKEAVLRRVREGPAGGGGWSLILLDVRFDQRPPTAADATFGYELLDALRAEHGDGVALVVLTREGESNRRLAGRKGADGYVPKEALSADVLRRARFERGLYPDESGRLLGSSPSFLKVLRELRQVTRSASGAVLLLGETGTGKTELAHFVHDLSGRRGALVKWTVNPQNVELHYSQLFGYWRGAFHGAAESMPGEAEKAHGGTLFIDEVAEMSRATQVQMREYRDRDAEGLRRVKRLGHRNPADRAPRIVGRYAADLDRILVDTLLVTATSVRLDLDQERGRVGFDEDLFGALGARVVVPSLRDRRIDIAPLFMSFLKAARRRRSAGLPDPVLTGEALDALERCPFSRNIRQLRDVADAVDRRLGTDFGEVLPGHLGTLELEIHEDHPGQRRATARSPEPRRVASRRGELARREVEWILDCARMLREAVEVDTRTNGSPSIPVLLLQALNVDDVSTADGKRLLKRWLDPIFAPGGRDERARRGVEEPVRLRLEEVRRDPVLALLHDYASGKIGWQTEGRDRKMLPGAAERIATVLSLGHDPSSTS